MLGVGPLEVAEGCSGLARRTHISATSDELASLLARRPFPPPRGHSPTSAGLCLISLTPSEHEWMKKNNRASQAPHSFLPPSRTRSPFPSSRSPCPSSPTLLCVDVLQVVHCLHALSSSASFLFNHHVLRKACCRLNACNHVLDFGRLPVLSQSSSYGLE